MCWETSLTKCYPRRNNRATITSFIVLGLTLGLGPGRDAKLIFTNGDLTSNIYSSHSASQPPLYNTKYEMVQMLYLTGIYFDIFCNFLVSGAALAGNKQHQYGWNLWPTGVGVQWSHACHALGWSYFRFRECRENENDQFDDLPAIKMPSGGKNTSFSSTAVECTFVW